MHSSESNNEETLDEELQTGVAAAGCTTLVFSHYSAAVETDAWQKDYTAKFGYRKLYWDYEEDGTVWDMTASGPYLGLGIRF